MHEFREMVQLALYGQQVSTIRLGNVSFWIDDDALCYDKPTSKWDTGTVQADLAQHAKEGLNRALRALHYKPID